MNSIPSAGPHILQQATPKQLEEAAAFNHRELFCLDAACRGGEVQTGNGLTLTYSGNSEGKGMVPFPSLADDNAGAILDEMMEWYRNHTCKTVGCWSLYPPQPADLGIKLLARGFQPGWRPCWMALDLQTISNELDLPQGLHIYADNSTSTHQIKDLPYSGDSAAVSHALMQQYPEGAQRFLAVMDGKIVGQSGVFLTTGDYGAAGIYNVGVIPAKRKRGIGKAVVLAACIYAKNLGYRYAVLNATGRTMYERAGFTYIGHGLTWWLMSQRFITNPPSKKQVAIAEAIGKGDVSELDRAARQVTAEEINTPITNGMTLMELAVHCRQPASAKWLMQHGSLYSVLDLWDLGWQDEAAALLAAQPREVNRLYGDHRLTLLHIAAERNDMALAQLVLAAKPDLSIKDIVYDGNASGWANYLNRPTIAALIKKYEAEL